MDIYNLTQEDLVLRFYFSDPTIGPKISKHLSQDLFDDLADKTIVKIIHLFVKKYKRNPSAQELVIGLTNSGYSEVAKDKLFVICNTPLNNIKYEYAVTLIENFFKEKKMRLALNAAAENMHDKNIDNIPTLIPIFKDAVNFSLQMKLGLHLVDDVDEAMRRLHQTQDCIPSRINEICYNTRLSQTNDSACGGYYRKSLTLFMGQPNVGKSLIMCSEAAYAATLGYNVLYITLELAEEYVWSRIASNILNKPQYEIRDCDVNTIKSNLTSSYNEKSNGLGSLVVKWLKPESTPMDIENVIDEEEQSRNEIIDLVVVDYIGKMKPNRGSVQNGGLYENGVATTDQLRSIFVERNKAGMSAVQFNRGGVNKKDAGMENTGGSMGYAEVSDLMITIAADTMLKTCNLLYHNIVKNRFGDNEIPFISSVNKSIMLWTNPDSKNIDNYQKLVIEQSVQEPQNKYQNYSQSKNKDKQPQKTNASDNPFETNAKHTHINQNKTIESSSMSSYI